MRSILCEDREIVAVFKRSIEGFTVDMSDASSAVMTRGFSNPHRVDPSDESPLELRGTGETTLELLAAGDGRPVYTVWDAAAAETVSEWLTFPVCVRPGHGSPDTAEKVIHPMFLRETVERTIEESNTGCAVVYPDTSFTV